jgi:hypothetical protein
MIMPTEKTTVHTDDTNKTSAETAHTVDGEGLLNNYAIEPEMYEEDGGALSSQASDTVTVVDVFPSELEAKAAVLEMEHKGLRTDQISIVAKNYNQEPENSMNWEHITAAGGLAVVLTKLGISHHATGQFMDAIEEGKFLVIEIGNDREASQAQHVLEKAGHTLDSSN